MRYTEARLGRISEHLLKDIEKETVLWAPNFDDTAMEPTVLPARYPNLLVNGITGIAAGYATNIPPHNLSEAIDAAVYRIQHADCSLDELMEYIQGPDFQPEELYRELKESGKPLKPERAASSSAVRQTSNRRKLYSRSSLQKFRMK